MNILNILTVLILAYLLGSIPFGLIIVKILKGHDIRTIESGRTGGTNAGRAAGFGAGLLTGVLDFFKALVAVGVAQSLVFDPGLRPWMEAAAGIMAILGHNYPIYLIERTAPGKYRLKGGAGGAPCLGAAVAMFPPGLLIILPAALLVFMLVGYASLTTLSIAGIALGIFTVRAVVGAESWAHVVFGVIAVLLLALALRPNLKRLAEGNERLVGLRAALQKRAEKRGNGS